jgi:NTE family protein
MKRALVLSGGGAKGAFQFGAIRYIESVVKTENPGYNFDIIAGVSVGSLNGVMLAMNKYDELEKLWDTITNEDVYTGSLKLLPVIFRVIFNKKSALGNKPLGKLIDKYVRLEDVDSSRHDYRFGVVSLVTGEYSSLKASDFGDNTNFRKAILASTAMPVIWKPVEKIKLSDNSKTEDKLNYTELVDGGLRNVSPLGDIIDLNPDEIIIINCSSEKEKTETDSAGNLIKIAKRSLTEIAINEIFRSDIRQFLDINAIIKQLPDGVVVKKQKGGPYKYFNSILIEPDEDMGDSLDFSQNEIQKRISIGYDTAKKVFQGYQATV